MDLHTCTHCGKPDDGVSLLRLVRPWRCAARPTRTGWLCRECEEDHRNVCAACRHEFRADQELLYEMNFSRTHPDYADANAASLSDVRSQWQRENDREVGR